MPTLYLSPLQRLRNLFHLFCKEQLEQSQVVFSVVLSCYSSGKGSKEPGNKALETTAENMATPTFMQLYNFSSSYVKKKPSYFVNVSDTRCTEYEQAITPGNKRCFYFFFFFFSSSGLQLSLLPYKDRGVNYAINYTTACLLTFTVSFALGVYLCQF